MARRSTPSPAQLHGSLEFQHDSKVGAIEAASAAQLPADTPKALSALGDHESFVEETELELQFVETNRSLDETGLEPELIEEE